LEGHGRVEKKRKKVGSDQLPEINRSAISEIGKTKKMRQGGQTIKRSNASTQGQTKDRQHDERPGTGQIEPKKKEKRAAAPKVEKSGTLWFLLRRFRQGGNFNPNLGDQTSGRMANKNRTNRPKKKSK